VHEVAPAVVHVNPPGLDVTVYPVIVDPPSLPGAVHETSAEPSPATADTPVGASGATAGVTGVDADEAGPSPFSLVATTVNVYAVPLVSPDTVHEVAPEVVQVKPPGLDVTVYPVIAEPPSSAGAVHETSAEPSPATADTPVGAPGAPPSIALTLATKRLLTQSFCAASGVYVKVSAPGQFWPISMKLPNCCGELLWRNPPE
jgi:hypothetical protein